MNQASSCLVNRLKSQYTTRISQSVDKLGSNQSFAWKSRFLINFSRWRYKTYLLDFRGVSVGDCSYKDSVCMWDNAAHPSQPMQPPLITPRWARRDKSYIGRGERPLSSTYNHLHTTCSSTVQAANRAKQGRCATASLQVHALLGLNLHQHYTLDFSRTRTVICLDMHSDILRLTPTGNCLSVVTVVHYQYTKCWVALWWILVPSLSALYLSDIHVCVGLDISLTSWCITDLHSCLWHYIQPMMSNVQDYA